MQLPLKLAVVWLLDWFAAPVSGANSCSNYSSNNVGKFCHDEPTDIDSLIQSLIDMGLTENSLLQASGRRRSSTPNSMLRSQFPVYN